MVMSDINLKLSKATGFCPEQQSMANPGDGVPSKKPKLSHVSREDFSNSSHEELVERIIQQQEEIETLKNKTLDPGLDGLTQTVERLKQQVTDSTQQENKLVMRLAAKEQEVQELTAQIQEMKSQSPSASQLSSRLLDPAVNLMFCHMKQEIDQLKSKLEQAQNDLAAWKFTPDSQTGKRLMAKCRMLLQENEELGKNVSTGRVAKLEGDIALQKTLITEMKKSESATEEFLAEADEDMEAMQNTVFLLKQELKDARERLQKYESTAATSAQSCDIQNGRTLSVEKTLVIKEEPRTDFCSSFELTEHSTSISDTDRTTAACLGVGYGLNSFGDAVSPGQLTLDSVERVTQNSGQQEVNFSRCEEHAVDTSDVAKNHTGCRTSPAGQSTIVDKQPLADSLGSRGELRSAHENRDKHCCEPALRTANWKTDASSDAKLNGLNMLVPITDDSLTE